jgi:hypothetical protein
MKRPPSFWLLLATLLFLALGGLYGGGAMLADPSGGALGMEGVLPDLPVQDFVAPGWFLLLAMGAGPLLLIYALVARPGAPWAAAVARRTGHHWSWAATLGLAVLLAGWLALQGLLMGFRWPIQYVTAATAIAIAACALGPGVRRALAR